MFIEAPCIDTSLLVMFIETPCTDTSLLVISK